MLRKFFSILAIALFTAGSLSAQNDGAIKVKVIDKDNGETVPFASVGVERDGVQISAGMTDFDGQLVLKPLAPGKYDVKVTYVGYQTQVQTGVVVSINKTTYLDMNMTTQSTTLETIEVVEYSVPLIDPDTKSSKTVDRETYQNMATKNVASVAATSAGVFQKDEGGGLSFRGDRGDGNDVYIDGVKVIGSAGLPQQAVEQITVITGGIPAMYGDATGGVLTISTRGPQSAYFGNVEAISSEFLDGYGYNSLVFSAGGPILAKFDTATGRKDARIGFFLSGQGSMIEDGDPSALGNWKVKDDVLADLQANPLKQDPSGIGFNKTSELIRSDDLESIKVRQNAASVSYNLLAKLDFKLSDNLNLTLSGFTSHSDRHSYIYTYSLFNSVNNPQAINNTYRGNVKLTQKFGNSNMTKEEQEKSSSLIKNAFYSINASYELTNSLTQDDNHQDRFFDYGYIGKFTHYKGADPTVPGHFFFDFDKQAYYQAGFIDTMITFEPGALNPIGVNYTQTVFDYFGDNNQISYQDFSNFIVPSIYAPDANLQTNLALLNGDRPSHVYSLWYNTGRQYNGYAKSEASQFRVFTNFEADIKNHAIQMGFEYEQRETRSFSVSPIGLWTLMRQSANAHILELDTANPILLPSYSGTYDYYGYDRKFEESEMRQFAKSLREKLGLPENSTQWIDTDAMNPEDFSLDMFSADELINSGLVGYNGYDHTGKKLTGTPSFDDFFTKTDENGNLTREIGAYRPIYVAGYIQDQFDLEDIKFRIGVRVDRFDNNQPVLKDPYLFYEAKTAGEVANLGEHPGNIGDDYVVYVNDVASPTSVLGYRNGDTWYNAQGVEIADPAVLSSGTTTGGISPYLQDPNQTEVNSSAFKDYDPQINIMPRVAFSFPISDMAEFTANYDVLAQRPAQAGLLNPLSYLFFQTGNFIGNPNLKPPKTINYELGFQQVLSDKKNSALKLSAFYREQRDMITTIPVIGAYPDYYNTYGNEDFGTVKGFTVEYNLRRTNNISMYASYTLQFSDATGSSASSGASLLNTEFADLKIYTPTSFDQRHNVSFNTDYHWGSGMNYDGPAKLKKVLQGAGANLTANLGSGTPYTAQGNFTPDAMFGVSTRSVLRGSVNGSRTPWITRLDLRVDKNFVVNWKKAKEGEEEKQGRKSSVQVYVQCLNVLDSRNVMAVYRATGSPTDDGYLSSAEGQVLADAQVDPESFRDLYNIAILNPGLYSRPRTIRLGVVMNF